MGVKSRESRERVKAEIARLVALPSVAETTTERVRRLHDEDKAKRRAISGHLGASATVKKYAHGGDCHRWMTGAEYLRDYAGSRAVVVREEHVEDSPRVLVHLCGIKASESCAIGAVYNRIPDSRVSRSDTTDMIQRCHQHPRGYVQGALRDVATRYNLGKPTYI